MRGSEWLPCNVIPEPHYCRRDCKLAEAALYRRHSRLSLPCRFAPALSKGHSQEHAKSGLHTVRMVRAAAKTHDAFQKEGHDGSRYC